MDLFLLIGVAVIGAGLLVGIIFYMYRRDHPKIHKAKGRDNAAGAAVGAARSFARGNGFRCIAPANLARSGRFARMDALVVGSFGVLGVKALGYNGTIYGAVGDKDWLQVSDGDQRTRFPNPIVEAAADVRVIRDALFSAGLKKVPVEVLCVFTDAKVQIALPRDTGHYTMKTFKAQLRKDKYLEENGVDMEAVEKLLRESLSEQ